MSFWSGERLAIELKHLLKDDFNPAQIDCASYRLRLGDQAFVTSDKSFNAAPGEPLVQSIGDPPSHIIKIPPGQFAFLLTQEIVKVPRSALALISMRAGQKFKGLINVSGFHVDPGWEGRLIFGVYNAGPSDIILHKGQELFLIVYADLDRPSQNVYKGSGNGRNGISSELIQGMTGQVFSPMLLQRKIEELNKNLQDANNKLKDLETQLRVQLITHTASFQSFEEKQRIYFFVTKGVAGFVAAIVVLFISSLSTDSGKRVAGEWIQSVINVTHKSSTTSLKNNGVDQAVSSSQVHISESKPPPPKQVTSSPASQ
ncbi:dCTP deaminase domain-containing protein [Undibacterium sp. Ji42W]|uniref:dCTP deaminase domain-containing protein n=1 Tax=Undibacterium sp. Ji42W TaxID=3413039 RepID=UPI003BF0CF62